MLICSHFRSRVRLRYLRSIERDVVYRVSSNKFIAHLTGGRNRKIKTTTEKQKLKKCRRPGRIDGGFNARVNGGEELGLFEPS